MPLVSDRPRRIAAIKQLLRKGPRSLKEISAAMNANLTDTLGDMAVLVNRGHVSCERTTTERSFGQKVPVYTITTKGLEHGS